MSREIGQGIESKLLSQILSKIKRLTQVLGLSASYAGDAKASAEAAEEAAESVRKVIYNAPYLYPDWWEGERIPLSISNSKASFDYDVSRNINLEDYTPYYISPTGSNSNDGLSESTPKATLLGAVSSGAELVYMLPGIYLRDTFYGNNFNSNIIVIGIGEVNITSGQGGLSWTLTNNNTYVSTRSGVTNVVDFNFKNKYGFYRNLKQVSSQALCEAESGTYYTNNVSVWVHNIDDREPDSKTLVLVSITYGISSNDKRIYFENLNFYDYEVRSFSTLSNSSLRIYMKNVNVALCKKPPITGTTEFNCFRFEGFKTVILQNCIGIESTQDIFNYHNFTNVPLATVIEINCRGYNAGILSSEINNQISSAHDGIKILRINGSYYGGQNQVIYDTNDTTQSVLVGCELTINPIQNATDIFRGVNVSIFGCKLLGNKIIRANTGGVGITIENSVVQYSELIGNVTII